MSGADGSTAVGLADSRCEHQSEGLPGASRGYLLSPEAQRSPPNEGRSSGQMPPIDGKRLPPPQDLKRLQASASTDLHGQECTPSPDIFLYCKSK